MTVLGTVTQHLISTEPLQGYGGRKGGKGLRPWPACFSPAKAGGSQVALADPGFMGTFQVYLWPPTKGSLNKLTMGTLRVGEALTTKILLPLQKGQN
jgi:hypothetical protein